MGKVDEIFLNLISELSLLLDCPPPDRDADREITSVRVIVDGTAFLISRQDTPAGLFTIHCSFGSLADDASTAELLRILRKNTELASRCAGTLGVDGASRHVIYSCFAALRGMTASQLLQGLHQCAGMARSWRETIELAVPHTPDQPLHAASSFV